MEKRDDIVIDTIQAACIDTQPGILSLEATCEFVDDGKIWTVAFAGNGEISAVDEEGNLATFDPETIDEDDIIGRPCRLADVVLMLAMRTLSMPLEERRAISKVVNDTVLAWELSMDDLRYQPFPTTNVIADFMQ